jgi:hypothetical protein
MKLQLAGRVVVECKQLVNKVETACEFSVGATPQKLQFHDNIEVELLVKILCSV